MDGQGRKFRVMEIQKTEPGREKREKKRREEARRGEERREMTREEEIGLTFRGRRSIW